MYLEKSVLVKKKWRKGQKKKDRDTERASDGRKRHANYGSSSPVSIPSSSESVVRLNCAKLAQLKRASKRGFGWRLEACAAAQGGHIEK